MTQRTTFYFDLLLFAYAIARIWEHLSAAKRGVLLPPPDFTPRSTEPKAKQTA